MMLSINTYKINYLQFGLPVVLIPDHAQASLYRRPCSFESPPPVFIKPVHFLNLGTQNAPDCVSEHLNFQNFPECHAPGLTNLHDLCLDFLATLTFQQLPMSKTTSVLVIQNLCGKSRVQVLQPLRYYVNRDIL